MIDLTLQLCICALLGAFTGLGIMVVFLGLCVCCKEIAKLLEP